MTQELQLVVFQLGQEEYGVDIQTVQEIIRPVKITRVPGAPEHVEGVIDLRGKIIPVIDLHKKLQLGQRQNTESARIIVVQVDDALTGIIVDGVSEVLRLPAEQIEKPDMTDEAFIEGVGKLNGRLIILLKIERLFD